MLLCYSQTEEYFHPEEGRAHQKEQQLPNEGRGRQQDPMAPPSVGWVPSAGAASLPRRQGGAPRESFAAPGERAVPPGGATRANRLPWVPGRAGRAVHKERRTPRAVTASGVLRARRSQHLVEGWAMSGSMEANDTRRQQRRRQSHQAVDAAIPAAIRTSSRQKHDRKNASWDGMRYASLFGHPYIGGDSLNLPGTVCRVWV